jgi:hypothetical protein
MQLASKADGSSSTPITAREDARQSGVDRAVSRLYKTNLNGYGGRKRLRRAPAKRCASRCSARTPTGTFTRWENVTTLGDKRLFLKHSAAPTIQKSPHF